ncbi:MAG: flagellar biosynthetic protein FliO [Phycisphaerales bacterium]
MTLRNALPWMAATTLVTLVCVASHVAGAQSSTEAANDPAAPSAPQAVGEPSASPSAPASPGSHSAETARISVQVPPRESTPLGRPNTIFSARPHDDPSAEKNSVLAVLDPRTNGVIRVAGALALVMVLVLATRSVLKRFGGPLTGGRPSGVLQVLARFPIGRGQHLVLLQLGRRIVLVHQTKNGMTTLSDVSDPDEVAQLLARVDAGSSEKRSAGFQTILGRLMAHGPREEWEQFRTGHRGTTRFGDGEVIDLTRRAPRHRAASSARRRVAS